VTRVVEGKLTGRREGLALGVPRRALSPVGRLSLASLIALGAGGWCLAACGAMEASLTMAPGDGDGDGDAVGDGDGDPIINEPPEVELEESFRAPVVSGEYLWSANAESNKVARINAATFDIDVLDGGHAPTFLTALPPGATGGGALVLNTLGQDASIFLMDSEGEITSHERLKVQRGASAWAVGATGKFAIAWSRSSENLLSSGDGYQDLTVFDFRGDEVATAELSVGFRPSKVMVNEDETHAYVVSDPGISVLSLESDVSVLRELFLPASTSAAGRDVSFTADGRLALVRIQGSANVLLVDTETNSRVTVSLPGAVTDLDLSADGSTAVAVMRSVQIEDDLGVGGMGGGGPVGPGESYVAIFSTETIFNNPDSFTLLSTAEVVGSAVVAQDGSKVLLFTNATANNRLTILDTASRSMRVVDLKAPVLSAFLSEDAAHSVVLMGPPAGSTKAGAFALVPVAAELPPRIEGTDTRPEFVAIAAEQGRALVTTAATSSRRARAYVGRFPTLRLDQLEIPSKPVAVGVVPDAGQAFIAQEHPEGRVTFVALDSGAEKTITGFELSSKVVD
jgi:hypothetical protein